MATMQQRRVEKRLIVGASIQIMTELVDGRVSYVPFLDDDFEILSKEPMYFGFSFRDSNWNKIYDCPLWVVFEDKK